VTQQFYLTDLWHILPDFVVEDVQPLVHMLPLAFRKAMASISWTCMPAQMHAMVLAAFASLVGPFGVNAVPAIAASVLLIVLCVFGEMAALEAFQCYFEVEGVQPLVHMLLLAFRKAMASISWTCMPAQMHAMVLAAFASLVGPFGANAIPATSHLHFLTILELCLW
jgi:hypothetical protein